MGNIDNYEEFTKHCINACDKPVSFAYHHTKTTAFFEDTADWAALKEQLVGDDIGFHTYAEKGTKTRYLVLKGLPIINDETIKRKQENKEGVKACKVVYLKPRSENSNNYPKYLVVLDNTEAYNIAVKLTHLNNTKIYWEPFRNQRVITQCFRCQGFGHGASSCNLPPKCVKCGNTHHSRECIKDLNQPPTCANCQGNHTASYRMCPTYVAKVKRIEDARTPAVKLMHTSSNHFPSLGRSSNHPIMSATHRQVTPQLSYGQALKSPPQYNSTDDVSDFMTLAKELKMLNSLCDLKVMIQAVRKLNAALSTCNTQNDIQQISFKYYPSDKILPKQQNLLRIPVQC